MSHFDPLDRVLPIEHLGDIASTTEHARKAVEAGHFHSGAGAMFVARTQLVGRGRFGREWYSPAGGLWATIAWPVDGDPRSVIEGLALRVGCACLLTVRQTLSHHGHGAPVALKWPNDVLINEKKVCGCISQVVRHGGRTYLLIGVGMNANNNTGELPEDLRRPATSLAETVDQPVDMPRLERELRRNIHRAVTTRLADAETLAIARASLHGRGRTIEVRLTDGSFKRGTLIGLSDEGRLELDCHGQPFVVPSGADLA